MTFLLGILSRDRDKRRLAWLLRLDRMRIEHRTALQPIAARLLRLRSRAVPGDRETVRVLFNLYSGRAAKVLA